MLIEAESSYAPPARFRLELARAQDRGAEAAGFELPGKRMACLSSFRLCIATTCIVPGRSFIAAGIIASMEAGGVLALLSLQYTTAL